MIEDLKNWLNRELSFKHIPYKEKISRASTELSNTDPEKVMQWWWEKRDDMLWGIFWGKIYLIGAISGNWKSTFVNQVCRNVSATWVKVAKYSLEDRMEDIWKEEIFYLANRLRISDWLPPYKRSWFVCNKYEHRPELAADFKKYTDRAIKELSELNIVELDKSKAVTIKDLVYLIEEESKKWTRLFVIDHLHYFERESNERKDIQITNAMHSINEVARKHNVAVLLVAHYRKNVDKDDEPELAWFKDWASIVQVSNIVIQIQRDFDKDTTKFHFTKIRWPIKPGFIETKFNLKTFEYEFVKSKDQIEREKKFIW